MKEREAGMKQRNPPVMRGLHLLGESKLICEWRGCLQEFTGCGPA